MPAVPTVPWLAVLVVSFFMLRVKTADARPEIVDAAITTLEHAQAFAEGAMSRKREREPQNLVDDFSISDVLVGRIVFDILAAMMVVNWDGELPYENARWGKVSRARHAAAAREVAAA